ncbi:hypothetical protein HY487_00945 [Candidatus Woesearchaeota archaeon]|nr:hypothetical protein [Candidatus Woesearchaeota archaeon]
MLSADLTLSD